MLFRSLWILGPGYAGLHQELLWMLVASTLWTWGDTLYSMGCARGWVLPVGVSVSTGTVALLAAAAAVDVSTVRGTFMVNAASGVVSTVVAFAYFAWQLRRHARADAPVMP